MSASEVKMNTAKTKGTAMEYIKKAHLNLRVKRHFHVFNSYKNGEPKDNDNSAGGSTTHVSSSGSEHGGGGGSF